MISARPAFRSVACATLVTLGLCVAAATPADAGPRAYLLTSTNQLQPFNLDQPGVAGPPVTITGLTAGDTLVGIDFRPQNGFLYGLGHNAVAGTVALYAISVRTGQAAQIGTSGTYVDAGGFPLLINGTSFGFDFNPATDRIRVVNDAGQNFRMNPNTGAFIDGDLGGSAGSVTGLNMDGPINGGAATVDAAAYTNNQPNAFATTLYTLNPVNNTLYIQNPPNAGTQTVGKLVVLNAVGLNFTAINGFDIPPGVNVAVSNTVAAGSGYMVATVGAGTVPSLYAIDLTTAAATNLGSIVGVTAAVRGFAIQGEAVPGGVPAIVTSSTNLVRFNTATLGTSTTVSLTGLFAGETIVAIDWRPQTGQLYGLGFAPLTGTGAATLYLIDPQTGACTIVGSASGVANGAGVPLSLAGATAFGFDFNPTVDRIRVVTSAGQNFRLNPNNGALSGSDGAINGLSGGATGLGAAAYTNSFGQPLVGGVTTLYTLEPSSDRLYIQNPPNNGTQTLGMNVTLSGAPLDFSALGGFDIPAPMRVATSNTVATGRGYAILQVGGVSRLYGIELSTGAATLLGTPPVGSVAGFTLGDGPPISTSAAITSSQNPSVYGQPVTFTATITPASAPGPVAFTNDGVPIVGCEAVPVVGGTAACTSALTNPGSRTILVYYGQNDFYLGTFTSLTQVINQIVTTTSIIAAPSPAAVNEPVTFTATVAPSAATGSVTFFVDGGNVGTVPLASGQATFIMNSLAAGTRQITATYSGSVSHATSTSAPFALFVRPPGPLTQYFAEGASGFFHTDIGIVNASATDTASVTVRLFPEGASPVDIPLTLPALARTTIDLAAVLGDVAGASTLIVSDKPVAAMRQMTWGNPVYGSTLESGIPNAAATWYFAEGATNVFSLFYLIQNPGPTQANVTFTHLLEGGAAPVVQNEVVPPSSRKTFFVNAVPGLETASMSTVITSTVPIVAERAMYLNGTPRLWEGGSAGRGATTLSPTWSFAEGATGFFHTYLLLGNPNTGTATATVTYLLPDGTTIVKTYTVPGQSRHTVDVNNEDAQLVSTAVGMTVNSTLPIVSERAMWWGLPIWNEGSAALGSTETGKVWAIGEGAEEGPNGEGTFVLVANASGTQGTVRFTVSYDDGTWQQKDYTLLGNARLTVRIGEDFTTSVGKKFSVIVESLTDGVPITVDVSRYQSASGFLGAGGAASATKIIR